MRFSRFALAVLSTSTLAAFAVACSSPVPPTPQGAWIATLINSSSDCKIAGHTAHVGSVSSNSKDQVPQDGAMDGTQVSCQVTGTTSFSVSGLTQLGGEGLQITIPKIDPSATKMAPADGFVTFNSVHTANPYSSPAAKPCHFYFIPGTQEGVASGKIWVAFTCDTLAGEMSTCSMSESFAIFENCTE